MWSSSGEVGEDACVDSCDDVVLPVCPLLGPVGVATSSTETAVHQPLRYTVSLNPPEPPAAAAPSGDQQQRRGHSRSASHGAQMPGPSILKDRDRVSALKRTGHARAFSHGQIGMEGLDGVERTGSRTEFTLPVEHEQRQRTATRSGSTRHRTLSRSASLFHSHRRQASRSESIYTLRQPQQRSSIFDCLCFWRKKTAEEARLRQVVPNHSVPPDTPVPLHPNSAFCNNYVRTTKYTLLSFIPKNLFEQFHRFANLYFLFIVLLNWVPEISAFGKEVAMLPLVFVMGVTAIKDLFEDRRRYNSDNRVNNASCRVYDRDRGHYVPRLWKKVRVGDLVHLSCDELIPADILLLHCSDSQNVCYIDTGNLDGETNLKPRRVVRGLENKRDTFHASKFFSTVECNPPTTKLYRFFGSMVHASSQQRVPITSDNLVLRECVLKNTDYVEGIVVFAGHETKALLNNGGPRYKRSRLERQMNLDVIYCVVILLLLCFTGATGSGLWLVGYNDTIPFFPFSYNSVNPPLEGFVTFWTFVIILQVMVPMSLYVTLEIIKLMQVYHIHQDRELYDPDTDQRTECRALNITEELGQIQYLFSDKTGTLTENQMVFRQCTIGGIDYNHDSVMEPGGKSGKPSFVVNRSLVDEVNHLPPSTSGPLQTDRTQYNAHLARVRHFFLLMACCNTVIVAKHPHKDKLSASGTTLADIDECSVSSRGHNSTVPEETTLDSSETADIVRTPKKWRQKLAIGKVEWLTLPVGLPRKSSRGSVAPSPGELRPIFEAESPDEMALVEAAYKYSVKLLRRTSSHITVSLPSEGLLELEVLHVLPFDSDRKRMSVILRHPVTRQLTVYTKGADSSMLPMIATPTDFQSQEILYRTQQQLNVSARRGLRVLVMAKRDLSEDEYSLWLSKHVQAETSLDDREFKLARSYSAIENSLSLLGCTGVEDRLQEGVPETLAALREAGVVVWVLTGDKQETAINIAFSCRLFSQDMEVIKINARSRDAAERTVNFYLQQLGSAGEPRADTASGVFIKRRPATPASLWSTDDTLSITEHSGRKALVVDGKSLTYFLDARSQLQEPFLRLTSLCSAVMCCRTTPLQKACLVRVVKNKLRVLTMAIGDGANDVSMIQTADVGVGISGQEGRQAVMASDFTVARFRFLRRLLLVHGHWCYDRLARTILYFFYKNAVFVFVTFWYQLFCGFSGTMMVDQIYWNLFNLFFTSLPPFAMGIYDRDCPADLLMAQPRLYTQGRLSQVYQPHSFWIHIADALFQSIVIFFIATYSYVDTEVGLWEYGTTVVVSCLFTMLLHASIEIRSWTWIHAASIVLSVLCFFVFGLIYNAICLRLPGLAGSYWVIMDAMTTPTFYLTAILTAVVACIPRLVLRTLWDTLYPTPVVRACLQRQRHNNNSHAMRQMPMPWSSHTSLSSVVRSTDFSTTTIEKLDSTEMPSVA